MKYTFTLLAIASALSTSAYAENWADHHHDKAAAHIDGMANKIDAWIGRPNLNKPASATIRVMLDNQWNRYEGYSIKPRVRAKLKLPGLKNRFSVVIGDEDLDNRTSDKTKNLPNYQNLDKKDYFDRRQARNDNASLALRWSNLSKSIGVETDLDFGLRSGGDVYGRFKVNKEWLLSDALSTRLEQIYRYGSNSKHYARTNFEVKQQQSEQRFLANLLYVEYTHDIDEKLQWGDSLYYQHDFANYKKLNYGLFAGGDIKHKKPSLNSYGPFISWRQPIWRDWLFFQTELNYYNNKEKAYKHHPGAFLRLEMIF